MQTRTDSVVSS